MPASEELRVQEAEQAQGEKIAAYLHDPSMRVMKALLENSSLNEDHILIITSRKNISGEILDRIFKDKRWADSYPVKRSLASNPKTPLFTAISLARHLRLFDLAALVRNVSLSAIFRKKIEAILAEKIPSLALGVKKTLAKTASGNVLLSLIKDGYPEVVKTCLDNPSLTESSLYTVINRNTTGPGTIREIADHPNWSSRYQIRYALIRNGHTPLARVVQFLTGIRGPDLRELHRDPSVPPEVRPAIHRELADRNEDPDRLHTPEEEPVHEITESEYAEIEQEMNSSSASAANGNDHREQPEEE